MNYMKMDTRCMLAALSLLWLLGCDADRDERKHKDAPPAEHTQRSDMPQAQGEHLKRIEKAKVLRIGIKNDSPPFCFVDKDGNPQGFDVDLGFRLARGLNVQPLFVTVNSAERIEKLQEGAVDVVIATLTATRRRAKQIDFSLPYFQDQQGVLVASDSAIKSYRDLTGKKVGAASGTTSLDNIKIVAPDAKLTATASLAAAFESLKAGELDAITGDSLMLQALRINSDPAKYRMAGEGFSVEPYIVGLPQNDSQLRDRVDEILTELWNSGAWTRIFNKWLGAQSPYNLEAKFQMPVLPP